MGGQEQQTRNGYRVQLNNKIQKIKNKKLMPEDTKLSAASVLIFKHVKHDENIEQAKHLKA